MLSHDTLDGFAVVGPWEPAQGDPHLRKLELDWDGKRVPIPNGAFQSIFNPLLKKVSEGVADEKDAVRIRRSEDGNSLLMVIPIGGDASRLEVALLINKQGLIARFLMSGEV